MSQQPEPNADSQGATLSVVLAATHDADTLREAIRFHTAGIAEFGGELLIADGTSEGLPAEVETAVHIPGADVFTLRAAAASAATGSIVAITEDHCVPAPNWHSAIVQAHEQYWDHAAVGGAIFNGTDKKVMDRANFMFNFISFLPPLDLRHPYRSSPPVNLSIKRTALDEYELVPGLLEMEIVPHMYRVGELVQDERMQVRHFQSVSFKETMQSHFHNGRSSASLPFRRPPIGELVKRTAHNLVLPFLLLKDSVVAARGKLGYRREFAEVFPLVVMIAFAHSAGELVGTLFGPGNSPKQLE